MRTKSAKILISVMLALCTFASVFLTFFGRNGTAETILGNPTPNTGLEVGFKATSYVSDGSFVYVEIGVTGGELVGDVTVKYHTESRTAIAGEDFSAMSGEVKLTSEKQTATVSVSTYGADSFSVVDSTTKTEYKRFFIVMIDSVENATLGRNTTNCYLKTGTELIKKSSSGINYFSEYSKIQHNYDDSYYEISDESAWKSYDHGFTLNNETTRSWVNNYINTGLADAYATPLLYNTTIDFWRHTAPGLWVIGNAEYSWNGKDMFNGVNSSNCDEKTPSVMLKLKYDTPWWSDTEGFSFTEGAHIYYNNGINPYKENDKFLDLCGDSFTTRYKKLLYSYSGYKDGNGNFRQSVYYKVKPYQGKLDVRMALYNYSEAFDKRLTGYEVDMLLLDSVDPFVKAVYLDDISLKYPDENGKRKLRLIVRYNEPVYSDESKTLSVNFNGNVADSHRFSYVGGNFTDTQYYEYDISDVRTNIKKYSISFPNSIYDLGYKLNSKATISNNSLDATVSNKAPCNFLSDHGEINYRDPSLSAECGAKTTKYNYGYNIYAALGGTDELGRTTGVNRGKLYYQWDTESGNITSTEKYGTEISDFKERATVSISGKETWNLTGKKEKVQGVWVMKYSGDTVLELEGTTFSGKEITVDGKKFFFAYSEADNGNIIAVNGEILKNAVDERVTFTGTDSVTVDKKIFNFNWNVLTIERIGEYYLHLYGISEYGLFKYKTFGPYKVDGANPELTVEIPEEDNQMRVKTFTFTVNDRPASGEGSSGVSTVSLNIKQYSGEINTYELWKEGVATSDYRNSVKKAGADNVWKYVASIDRENLTGLDLPLDAALNKLIGNEIRLSVELSFTLTDKSGNSVSTPYAEYTFDKRDGFQSKLETYVGGEEQSPIYTTKSIPVFNLGTAEKIIFNVVPLDMNMDDVTASWLVLGEDENGEEIKHDGFIYSVTEPGYYEFMPELSGEKDGNPFVKVSTRYRVYVTRDEQDETVNFVKSKNDLVLSNVVYQLKNVQFTYLTNLQSSVTYEKYGGSLTPTFSSYEEAVMYLTYMEYQDMYLIRLNEQQARNLRSSAGSTTYMKADGEVATPSEGQLWIRYKRESFKPSNGTSEGSNETNGWAFYFYAEEGDANTPIDVSRFDANSNIGKAVASVVSSICKAGNPTGAMTYLIDEEHTDTRTNAPKLSENAIHVNEETSTKSRAGNTLIGDSYRGDKYIYRNNVVLEEDVMPLATNMVMKVGKNTQIYFKQQGVEGDLTNYDASNPESGWNILNVNDGDLLGNSLQGFSTGAYTILELDEFGVHKFDVYIDRTLPIVYATVGDNDNKLLDGTDDTITGPSFKFNSFEGEIDQFAYVAIFNGNKVLQHVYYGEEVIGQSLSAGNYYVQIGDRSGNSFYFSVGICDSELNVAVAPNSRGDGMTVTVTGRKISEILRYEVYCNNERIDKGFIDTAGSDVLRETFRKSGIYKVYVQDIYGNVYNHECMFNRQVPDVIWSYNTSGDRYAQYDKDNVVAMTMRKDEKITGKFYVLTSSFLRFRIDSDTVNPDFEYTIEGIVEDEDYTKSTTGFVYVNTLKPWTLKVFYKDTPDNYVLYEVSADGQAPTVHATFITSAYVDDEKESLNEKAQVGNVGDELAPDSLGYTVTGTVTRTLKDGDIIEGSYIRATFEDEAGIRSVNAYLDGVEITDAYKDGVLSLTGYGEYKIVVVDCLGNPRTFTFINTQSRSSSLTIDDTGRSVSMRDKEYGHNSAEITVGPNGSTGILVKTENSTKYYVALFTSDNLYIGKYLVTERENKTITVKEATVVFPTDDEGENIPAVSTLTEGFVFDSWIKLDGNDLYELQVRFSESGYISYRVLCLKDFVETEFRYTISNNKFPDYFKVELSKELSDIAVLSGDTPVITNHDKKTVHVRRELTVPEITDEKIFTVTASYSETGEFGEDRIIYDELTGSEFFDFSNEGLYLIKITNVYGNVTEYYFDFTRSFYIRAKAEYIDGESNAYTPEYCQNGKVIYSNDKVTVTALGEDITFEITAPNGVIAEPVKEGRNITVVFDKAGVYTLIAKDLNLNEKIFYIEIGTDSGFNFTPLWVSEYFGEFGGFRMNGCFNTPATLTPDDDVKQIVIKGSNGTVKVYDVLAENVIDDPELLIGCVGKDLEGLDGDVYTVYFRNKFGDVTSVNLEYSKTPTLVLSRTTTSYGAIQYFDVADVLEKGIYSNNAIYFDTVCDIYKFTYKPASGDKWLTPQLPFVLEFSSESGNGSFSYEVVYYDKYGHRYQFGAYLYREDVVIDTESMELVEIDGLYYTANFVSVKFSNEYTATVSYDNGEKTAYQSGYYFRRDGKYHFVITDKAGNQKVFDVIHDSVINYKILDSTGKISVLNGGAINAESVYFSLIEDDGYIKYVAHNGKEIENYSSKTFSKNGFWQLMITDKIGNVSYFEFYLINHAVKEFDFTAPYGYTVSLVTFTRRGETDSAPTLDKGEHIVLTSNGKDYKEGIYSVELSSLETNTVVNFTVEIDLTPPTAKLVGCNDGEITPKVVTLEGLQTGDRITVYKDGNLIGTTEISSRSDIPSFEEGGNYVVEITNIAGVTSTFSFTKKRIANAATTIVIMVGCIIAATVVFVGLLYRNRSKTDD